MQVLRARQAGEYSAREHSMGEQGPLLEQRQSGGGLADEFDCN